MSSTKLFFIHELCKDRNYFVDTHSHPQTELVFYRKANGTTEINGNSYDFTDNSIAVINPNTPHNENHNTAYDIIFLAFSFEHFQIPNGVYKPKNFNTLEKIATQIYRETRSPHYALNLYISSKLNELMVLLVRELFSGNSDEQVHECMLYLSENCHKDIDMKKLSEKHNIAYDSFRRKFKKLYGMSPTNFIITQRLAKASDMLIKTNLSCTEIAYECGFSDSAQFSKLFKRQFGVSPKQFKNNYQH